jgi:hypothetical protein
MLDANGDMDLGHIAALPNIGSVLNVGTSALENGVSCG